MNKTWKWICGVGTIGIIITVVTCGFVFDWWPTGQMDDDDIDEEKPGKYIVQATLSLKVSDKLADDAAIGGIYVRFYDPNGILYGTEVTDATGSATSADKFWSDTALVIIVGTLANGTYEPQRYDITMPKSHDDDASDVYFGKLRFSPVATAAQIATTFYKTGITSALTTYNITLTGNTLEGYVDVQITVQDRCIRPIFDYSEWVEEELAAFFMIREQNNTAVEAVDYQYMSGLYSSANTLSHVLILKIPISTFAYDLDSQGRIIDDGREQFTYKYDFSSCTSGSNQTEFYMEFRIMIGAEGVLSSGAPPGDNLLSEYAIVPLLS